MFVATVIASSAAFATVGGCSSAEPGPPPGGVGAVAGAGLPPGAGTGGLKGVSGASSGGSTFGMGGGVVAGALSFGGAPVGTGGASGSAALGGSGVISGGTGGANSGGTGGAPKPCVDVEPPADPKWPGATCKNWATETTECGAAWFSQYCDLSCGRCVPPGGTGGSGGGSGGAASKPCVDVEPPPDPEWPGATCKEWSSETTACKESWFAKYCDVSCGRCVPEGGGTAGAGGGSAGAPATVDCSGEGLPNVSGGSGYATRYWDCCQPHCSQFNGHRCGQDGVQGASNQTSSCNGGGSFACYDEAPRAVSKCLSYGHIAKANPNCGACYRIQFTGEGYHNAKDPGSVAIKGKQMIVKVSNTGGDVANNQFDLMIPGGGVGMFNACSRQWGTNDLGAQYGGFLTECTGSHAAKKECVRQECMKIPAGKAREGCIWFVDWLEVADNPKFTSQETQCPF